MTDQTDATGPDSTEVVHDPGDTPDTDEQAASTSGRRRRGDSEAAARRVAQREAEAARDAALGRIERMQRREAERIAAESLSAPADLWDIGRVELADLLDDEGEVDADRVSAAAIALTETRPGLARPAPKFPDMGGGRRGYLDGTEPTWKRLMRANSGANDSHLSI